MGGAGCTLPSTRYRVRSSSRPGGRGEPGGDSTARHRGGHTPLRGQTRPSRCVKSLPDLSGVEESGPRETTGVREGSSSIRDVRHETELGYLPRSGLSSRRGGCRRGPRRESFSSQGVSRESVRQEVDRSSMSELQSLPLSRNHE